MGYKVTQRFHSREGEDVPGPRGERKVCPECRDHEQVLPSQPSQGENDCKNLFVEQGVVVGQCRCYSPLHQGGEE